MKWNKDIEVYNEDNMITMSRYPDNYFDLAVVDPPYGIGESSNKDFGKKMKNAATVTTNYTKKEWDKTPPSEKYFKELIRVSKHQIIWGVNNFNFNFSSGRIFWDKNIPKDYYSASKGEIAFKSISKSIDLIKITWNGMIQHNMKDKQKRIHPTEKPIALYEWIYRNYAKENFKILDTHLGSGSNALAIANMNKIENMNLSLVAAELDTEYFNASKKRFDLKTSQGSLFAPAA